MLGDSFSAAVFAIASLVDRSLRVDSNRPHSVLLHHAGRILLVRLLQLLLLVPLLERTGELTPVDHFLELFVD